MALKFKCPKCGKDIIIRFLKVGEVVKCQNCGTDSQVPENASEITQEPEMATPPAGSPYVPLRVRGKVRSFWKVLSLSIVTIGIYFWIYLFITILEMDYTFSFGPNETNPRKVRSILIAYLVISLLLPIITLPLFLSYWRQDHVLRPAGFHVLSVTYNIISGVFFIVASSSFIKLIELCQKKVGIVPLNRSFFWALIAIIVVISFVAIGIKPLAMVFLICGLVLLNLTVKQVNRVWTDSHEGAIKEP